MSRWEPHIDLMRLLEALGSEVVAATELEVREACAEGGWSMARTKLLWGAWPELQVEVGSSIARTAKEVRELIEAVNGDPDGPEIDGDLDGPEIDVKKGHIELRGSRHIHGVVERGRLTCYKQH
jgi:hypothetical protein